MASSPEEALAQVDRAVADAEARAARAHAYAADVESLQATGRSADGSAEVTVSHTGAMVDLYLGRQLADASLERIRAALLEANGQAQAMLGDRLADLTRRAFGEDSATTQRLVGEYRRVFPPEDGGSQPGPGVLR